MSPGITVLEKIAADAARALGGDFSLEIQETHHVHKLDAPSGTALKLGEAVAEARGEDPRDVRYKSERRGEVPGDHKVILASAAERLVLEHSVSTRDVFAVGALRAARWVRDQSVYDARRARLAAIRRQKNRWQMPTGLSNIRRIAKRSASATSGRPVLPLLCI